MDRHWAAWPLFAMLIGLLPCSALQAEDVPAPSSSLLSGMFGGLRLLGLDELPPALARLCGKAASEADGVSGDEPGLELTLREPVPLTGIEIANVAAQTDLPVDGVEAFTQQESRAFVVRNGLGLFEQDPGALSAQSLFSVTADLPGRGQLSYRIHSHHLAMRSDHGNVSQLLQSGRLNGLGAGLSWDYGAGRGLDLDLNLVEFGPDDSADLSRQGAAKQEASLIAGLRWRF